MVSIFLRSKKHSLVAVFWLLVSFGFLQAQQQKSIPDIEKIYLHTDRSTYFVGEDLWYKAYNVRASNNLLFDNSNILYVELISFDSKMIARNKTNLKMGLGHGDFQLVDSIKVKPGKYQLRAYTNWNRNFGDDFIFKKDIEIIDVFEAQDKTKRSKSISSESKPAKKEVAKQNFYKVEFFPEGGSLLENVACVVGFKAVDSNGKPIEINGELLDSNNELVTTFESVHDGMGKLQMLPMEGKSYYAKIKTSTGTEIRQELPNVLQQGYLLNFRTIKGRNIISISTNEATLSQNPNTKLTVICKAKGIPYLETSQILNETSLSFELPKDKTPEGISQITLFDNNKPQSERLIYVEKEKNFEVELETDKEIYELNEKAVITVSSKSKSGEGKSASFSLSVTDMNGVENDNFESNISSYFLMESDIRGKVYHPAYYFDTNNPKRLEHLDNLLLTQGWRDFVWKNVHQIDQKKLFKAEKGITISGRVKQLFSEKPLINNNLTLALMSKKNRNIFSTVTDSIGRFQFENLMFSGKTNMYLNTRDEKGKFRGEIVLDSIELAPIPILLKKEVMSLPDTISSFAENVLKKFIANGVKPENILKEVVIKSKNKFVRPVFYGVADYSYTADESTKKLTTIYDVLDKVPGVVVVDRSVYVIGASVIGVGARDETPEGELIPDKTPLILIDGSPMIDARELDWILPNDVEKIDVIQSSIVKDLFILEKETDGSVISIFTNGNRGNKSKKDPFHSIKKEIEGFYTARIFYSPDPEKPNPELDKNAAVRNTIYWNPYVHPDETGNASVNYYNTKVETKVKVALEGITANGIPVVKNTYYTIKK
ncbi:hypothetical protein GCM10008015_09540 [Flavobacterium palustre]|uniref:TonB-dependent receptor plug domain-containing protein n=1 Tax=Flavobacterium palustre TaxID=1476463 RepID=A0ABQ1HDL0_9FLAO|nr:TonB-dependent receptor plug domain-containing protein [Flavobacterium palustre]GGA70907.1 hypothetical protein GCM10008015_09540 [Flavobacterium palustre]